MTATDCVDKWPFLWWRVYTIWRLRLLPRSEDFNPQCRISHKFLSIPMFPDGCDSMSYGDDVSYDKAHSEPQRRTVYYMASSPGVVSALSTARRQTTVVDNSSIQCRWYSWTALSTIFSAGTAVKLMYPVLNSTAWTIIYARAFVGTRLRFWPLIL